MGPRFHWLYITTFLDLLATSLLVPFLPLHLRAYGLPRLVLGLLISVYPSVQLFSSPAVGFYSGRYGQKSTLIASLLLCSLAYYLLASTTSVFVIFLCRVMLGVVKHTQTISKAVFFSQNETFLKTYRFEGLSATEALGFMLGPVIGAHFIAIEDGFQYLCKITTVLFIVNAVIVYCFLPSEKVAVTRNTKLSEKTIKIYKKVNNVDLVLFWELFILKFVLCVSLSLFYMNYPVMLVEQLHMSPSVIGYTNSFQGLICLVVSLFSSNSPKILYFLKDYYVKLSFWFLMLSSAFFCFEFVTNIITFVILLIPLSCSSTLLRIYLTEALVIGSESNNKTSVIGVENTIATIASLMSPFIFEYFSFIVGKSPFSYFSFLLSGFGAVFSAILSFSLQNMTKFQ